MKRALLILTAIVFLASCMKKSTNHTKTYYCVKNDSLVSTIPVLSNPHYKVIAGYYQNYAEWQLAILLQNETKFDTIFNRHDTLSIEYWTITCEPTE